MTHFGRRDFLKLGTLGLAAAGTGALLLREGMAPTEASGHADDYLAFLQATEPRREPAGKAAADVPSAPTRLEPTEDNILGPYYRDGAPYRAKITPPLEPGTVLLIRGRVWGHDTRRPLAGVTLDIWQANATGRYDNDDPKQPPAKGVFLNRSRVLTDSTGYYEYETVHPGRYQIGPDAWRPSHIHYLVQHPGYKRLVTQLYFKGDPMNEKDQFIKPSLIIDLAKAKAGDQEIETGTFDVVLAKN